MNAYPMTYTIKKGRLSGKLAFTGHCPVCDSELKIIENEIGKRQPCPGCGAVVRPVSAILTAYKLTEAQKPIKDSVASTVCKKAEMQSERDRLKQEKEVLQYQLNKVKAERDALQAELTDLQEDVLVKEMLNADTSEDPLDELPELPEVVKQASDHQMSTVEHTRYRYYPMRATTTTTSGISNGAAAILSFFLAGLGQITQGRLIGLFIMFLCAGCYAGFLLGAPVLVLLLGGALHLLSVADAASHEVEVSYK
jgi:hypothetical protein